MKEEPRVKKTVMMPMKIGVKEPEFCHKNDKWGWEDADAYMGAKPDFKNWGLLLDGLCVIDCDDSQAVAWAEGEIGDLMEGCAVQETKKGKHYMFLRPDWADDEGFYDGARQTMVKGLQLDLKTMCSTGTRGLLSIAPTDGKRWLKAPWELESMAYITRELMEKVATRKDGNAKLNSQRLPKSFMGSSPVEKLLNLLGKSRWESRETWRDLATALKNEHGDTYKATWKQMSRMSAKYEEQAADKLWDTVGMPGYEGPKMTMRTVESWARADDPHGYALYRAFSIPSYVMASWEKGDYGLGQIAYELLRATVKKTGPGRGDYYHFDEETCRWARVDEGRMKSVACRVLDEVIRDVEIWQATRASIGTEEERCRADGKKKEATALIKYVRSQRGITNVMGFAGPLLMDETFEQRLDNERHLIGIKGGSVVDLRTGEKRPRVAEDMVHNELDVEYYSKDKTVPPWVHAMITEMMAGDTAMAIFLQRLLGYGITGEVREEVFPIWTGSGRNGKGLLTQSLQQLMGSYYREMNCAVISDSRVCSNIDAERAKLLGARLAVFNELKAGEKLKTNEVQLLTGGDGIPVKALYKDPITVIPRHLALLVTNYMPEMSDVIMAMVERLLCVEFPVTFRDLMPGERETEKLRQCDKTLKDRLKSAEGQSALFAWLVEGAVAWYASSESLRQSAPAKVREFTRLYLAEQDQVQAFLMENCEFGEGMRVSSLKLFLRYQEVHEDAQEKWFHGQIKCKGFVKKKTRIDNLSVQGYEGLQMK